MKRTLRIALLWKIGRYLWSALRQQDHELTVSICIDRLNGKYIADRTFNCYHSHISEVDQCR